MSHLQVTEIFHSIQGEGTCAGRPCVFVRLTGCPLRCVWCDTAYAFSGGTRMTLEEVLDQVRGYDCPLVEVTGGEPLAQPGCLTLLDALVANGYEVLLETAGSHDIGPVHPQVRRIMDLKCPGSGEQEQNRYANLALLTARDEVKLVIADRADYEWARDLIRRERLADRCPVLFSPVWGVQDPEALATWILADQLPVRMQLQLHKHIWDPARTGV